MQWTEERVEELRTLKSDGVGNGMIAEMWGVSRNVIVGKWDRIKKGNTENRVVRHVDGETTERRRKEREARRVARLRRKAEQKPLTFVTDLFVLPNEPVPLRISLIDITDEQCKWLCDETGDRCEPLYCGYPTIRVSSWCAHHYPRVKWSYR